MNPSRTRLIAGCMSGTSMDGVDAAITRVTGEGLDLTVEVVGFASEPFDEIRERLHALANGGSAGAATWAALATELGETYSTAIDRALKNADLEPGEHLTLCAAHGQTLHHAPPASLQLFNPWPIAAAHRCDVVYDLRGADLHAGGQGAPITPIADWVLFRDEQTDRAIVNLGGFCNATFLRAGGAAEDTRAFDVCACNHVLDGVARRALGQPFDADGAAASAGTPDPEAFSELASLLEAQATSNRSLGSGDEASRWIDRHTTRIDPRDLAASAVGGIGAAIAGAIRRESPEAAVFLAGGGANNLALTRSIGKHLGAPVRTTIDLGIGVQQREAVAMAVLGALAADGTTITLPAVTGRKAPAVREGVWVRGSR